jgi:ATP-dependent DNA helicase RecQ
MIRCIIVDLDGTLVDTSVVAELRAQRQWREVADRIQHCTPYQEAVSLVCAARRAGLKVALFTNSPSSYVRNIFRHFQIEVDYVVAYSDVRNHKPASEGVDKIRHHFGVSCEETIYIGDSEQDRECALNAQVKFFGAGWGEAALVGTPLSSATEILEYITSSVAHRQKQSRANLIQDGHRFFLGYYLDGIKQEVWAFKNGDKNAVERWINKAMEVCDALPHIDFVVRALGHAELDASANNTSLDSLGERLAASIGAEYRPDCLYKTRSLAKSTTCSAKERAQQVRGVYSATPGLTVSQAKSGPTVLIVDDVLTSGATTGDIARALSETHPGARVFIFTLVKTIYRAECERDSSESQQNAQLFFDLYSSTQRLSETATVKTDANRYLGQARLISKKFSANYANTNHNFVFQNLRSYSIASELESKPILDAVYVLRNMLQRGKPTIASRRLRIAFGLKQSQTGLEFASQALISPRPLEWRRLIRGDVRAGNYPAKRLFDELIPKYFGEYKFVKQLVLPEVNIFDMTQVYVDQFNNRQVDFFLPQAGLIIEIDGAQHEASLRDDEARDRFTQTLGLKTIRFTTQEIATENESFRNKISAAVDHLKMIDTLEQEGKLSPPNGLTLQDYRHAYNNGVDTSTPSIRLTAAIRFQLLVLELIESGDIRLGTARKLTLLNRDGIDFAQQAIDDLTEMLSQLLTLRGLPELVLKVDLEEIENSNPRSDGALLIDFSILERFDDTFQVNQNLIYARTHYLDFYRYFANTNALAIENCELIDYDFFQMSCVEPINYQIDLNPGSKQREALKFFLANLFLPLLDDVDFREGQIGIIGSALSRKGTIGLLPTGAGKSICYQLSAVLQPAISFVVCPIKSLMYDQKADLDAIGFSRSSFITSDLTSDQKARIQNHFGRGKYFFVFISPERFQTQGFRREMTAIGLDRTFAYAVIDEAHCLSEWGHDFRTSYLNLANTIEKLAPDSSYIGLTATASVNVLKDIQTEFDISDDNVRTPLDYTREELSFHVLDDQGHKTEALTHLVRQMEAKWNGFNPAGQGSKAGIIFTPTVNGDKGCFRLAGQLSTTLGMDVRYFSGSAPNNAGMGGDAFDTYKRKVQNDFKANKYSLLTATKAFGMGVNKGNIAYTVHYGIPGSMEALYQEAGRAGRDKRLFTDGPADSHILLTKERRTDLLDIIWDASTTVAELKTSVNGLSRESDVKTNLFLMTSNLDTINDEFNLLRTIYQHLLQNKDVQSISATAAAFGTDKAKFEKAVYRLFQLGIVVDWIVEDFFRGRLTIEFCCPDEDQLQSNLERKLRKYDTAFKLDDIFQSSNSNHSILCNRLNNGTIDRTQFIFLVLLLWSYDHFAYSRRQSLKTVYEQCSDLADGKISEDGFKSRLEGYFKFNESSHLLAHLAEHPDDSSVWLSVFFLEDPASESAKIVSQAQLSTLKEQLSRFLESYKDNICLNYLSGIIRLTADDFDDADGERRMAASLERLKQQGGQQIETLIRNTLELKPLFSADAQCRFARLIHEKFPVSPFLELINSEFEDPYSYRQLLTPLLSRMEKLTTVYKGIDW